MNLSNYTQIDILIKDTFPVKHEYWISDHSKWRVPDGLTVFLLLAKGVARHNTRAQKILSMMGSIS